MADGFWRWYEKANAVVRTFTGPAQLGAGYTEEADVRSPDAGCPICRAPMSAHTVIRATDQCTATRLTCP